MKKMLLGSITLLLFSCSILIIQISCSRIEAQTSSNVTTQLNKIVFTKTLGSGKEIWIANYDGSNAVQVPVTFPAGLAWAQTDEYSALSISPDGQNIFFVLSTNLTGPGANEIYSCDISGGMATLVMSGNAGNVAAF